MADSLLVTSSFLPGRGGIESYLAELCERLAPRLAVFAPGRRDDKALPEDLPYPAIGYPGSLLVPHRGVASAIERAAANQNTDKLLFGTPWPLALLGPRLQRAGLRYGVIVHGAELLVPGAVPLARQFLRRALARAELLLPVSRFTATALERLLGSECPPIEVLRARVDVGRFSPQADGRSARARHGLPPEAPLVLCLGRMVRRKGIDRLIEVLPRLAEQVPEVTLAVAGSGPQERRLRRLAAAKGGRVVFTGRVADADAPGLYAAAGVFALPVVDRWFGLDVEGLGVVLLEAAAAGRPCVTGRSGGTPEAVLDGRTGFVVDARDRDALANALLRLLTNPSLAAEMGAAGRAHVQAEFSGDALPPALVDWLSAHHYDKSES